MTEKEHPTLVKARELVRQQDVDGAEELLREFLRKHPDFALAHLQLGMVYQSKLKPIKAVYHFERYLEGRPETEKSEIIRQVVEDERRLLSATLSAAEPGSDQARIRELSLKLAETEQKLAKAELTLQQLQLTRPGVSREAPPEWAGQRLALLEEIERLKSVSSPPATERSASSPAAEPKTYTVKRGDTLSGISLKMYGRASNWRKIYEANQNRIPNMNVLSPGVELVIPE
ncbi:MAG: LysM peptidoglycan-binding domain-containing protein [Kiritimatiellia bacterium]